MNNLLHTVQYQRMGLGLLLVVLCWNLAGCAQPVVSPSTSLATSPTMIVTGKGSIVSFQYPPAVALPTYSSLHTEPSILGGPKDHLDLLTLELLVDGKPTEKQIVLYLTADTVLSGSDLHFAGFDTTSLYFGNLNNGNYKTIPQAVGTLLHYVGKPYKQNLEAIEIGLG